MSNKYSEREVERLRDSIPAQTQAAERAGLYVIAELLRTANSQLAAAREIVKIQREGLQVISKYGPHKERPDMDGWDNKGDIVDAAADVAASIAGDIARQALRLTEESSDE